MAEMTDERLSQYLYQLSVESWRGFLIISDVVVKQPDVLAQIILQRVALSSVQGLSTPDGFHPEMYQFLDTAEQADADVFRYFGHLLLSDSQRVIAIIENIKSLELEQRARAPVSVLTLDSHGVIIAANKPSIPGLNADEPVVGCHFASFFAGDGTEAVFAEVMEQQQPRHGFVSGNDGSPFYYHLEPVVDGDTENVLLIIIDVSAYSRDASLIAELATDIAAVIHRFKNETSKVKLAERRLVIVERSLQGLVDDKSSELPESVIKVIQDAQKRVTSISDSLGDAAAVLEQHVSALIQTIRLRYMEQPPLQQIHVATFMSDIRPVLMREAGNATLVIRSLSEVGDDDAVFWLDSDQVLVLLENLVRNSSQHFPEGMPVQQRQIEIRYRHDSQTEMLVIEIHDNGTGMDEGTLEKAQNLDTGSLRDAMRKGSSGIGLAIVKTIARRHRATYEVESTQGQGTTFRLTFFNRSPQLQD